MLRINTYCITTIPLGKNDEKNDDKKLDKVDCCL